MKKCLIFILCLISIFFCTSCSNGYKRAIKNYTGPTYLEETATCDTKITYDFEVRELSPRSIPEFHHEDFVHSSACERGSLT